MCEEITKATQAFNQYDACDECGKRTDGLTTCTYPVDDSTVKLCPDCMEGSGFCLRCGHYCSGQESFDFSEIEGYCSDCVDEINADFNDEEEDFPNGSLDY